MIKFENKENGRFYYMKIEKDLFNDIVVSIIRGGRHCSVNRLIYCNDEISASREIRRLSRVRLQRGYTLVN
jgi:hypothetical protein